MAEQDAGTIQGANGLPAASPAPVAPTGTGHGTPSGDRVAQQRERNARFAPITPERVPWRAVAVFVVLAMGLAWAACAPLWASGLGLEHPQFAVLVAAMMYSPTVAALVTVFLVDRPRSIPRLLGLGPIRPLGRTIGFGVAGLAGFCVLPFLALFLGSAMGMVDLDLENLSGIEATLDPEMLAQMNAQTFLMVSILALPVNTLVSAFATFGEELGWRGWLLPNLLPLGTWPALLASGLIWALWHAPIILLGYNYGYTDLRGMALMIGFCVPLGIVFGWLRLRTASVWPAVLAHAAVNTATNVTVLMIHADALDDVRALGLGTFLGAPGWIVMGALILALVLARQFRHRAQPGVPSGQEQADEVGASVSR
ncbi:CPBP family intramembrane glutamic endopeptidase [Ruania alba]|uniref:Membrane protease YdiL, CAAX protease family n=1 Tax=Ruania alba TaxID=648782 RepID=A0A1H5HVI4_9MICO|nr:type II CAAX endopeptidase family protein [Ruania alba]SEE31919.1 Membrane protease YdiL, CAAX protease family [Ruania alba]